MKTTLISFLFLLSLPVFANTITSNVAQRNVGLFVKSPTSSIIQSKGVINNMKLEKFSDAKTSKKGWLLKVQSQFDNCNIIFDSLTEAKSALDLLSNVSTNGIVCEKGLTASKDYITENYDIRLSPRSSIINNVIQNNTTRP